MTVGRAGGFSLLEMLLVLFIVVLLTSLVSLTVNSGAGSRREEQALRALSDAAAYALDEAQFAGRDFGLLLERNTGGQPGVTLAWRERLPQGWRQPARSGDVLTNIQLASDVTLLLDGQAVLPADPSSENAGVAPQWLFLASGETQAGELLLRDPQSGELDWRLEWDALGRFGLYRGDAVQPDTAGIRES